MRPQLTSINNDYFTLVEILSPNGVKYKNYATQVKRIKKEIQSLPSNCSEKAKEICIEKMENLQAQINSFMGERFLFPTQVHSLNFTRSYSDISHFLMRLERHLFNLLLMVSLDKQSLQSISLTRLEPDKLISIIIKIENDLHLLYLQNLPKDFKEHLHLFWNQFIRPVSQLILPKKSPDLFIDKMAKYNLSLNQLVMSMTKRQKVLLPRAENLLNVIHRRWNNILKVSLR